MLLSEYFTASRCAPPGSRQPKNRGVGIVRLAGEDQHPSWLTALTTPTVPTVRPLLCSAPPLTAHKKLS